MNAVLSFVSRHFRHNRLSFCLGIAAALVPSISGLLLLGVAGWFITAAGIAGATRCVFEHLCPERHDPGPGNLANGWPVWRADADP